MAGKSGFEAMQGSGVLHQPHQANMSDPGNMYARVYQFPSAGFGTDNMEIKFENIQMVLADAWLKVRVSRATTNAGELPPVVFWLSTFGLVLRHEGQEVARLTPAQMLAYLAANGSRNLQDYYRRAENWAARDSMMTDTATSYDYYLSLRPLIERLMSNFGPLNAYATGKWTLAVGFKAVTDIQEVGASATFTLDNMYLVLQGHLEDDANRTRVSMALTGPGLQIIADYPIEMVKVHSGSSTTFSFNATEGDCVGLVFWIRGYTAISAAAASRNARAVMDFLANNASAASGAADSMNITVSIGTDGAPNEYLGQPISLRDLARTYAQHSVDWAGPEFTNAAAAVEGSGMIVVPFSGKFTLADRYGVYTGSRSLKNNLQVQFDGTPALSGGYQIHVLALMRRSVGITYRGVEVVNTYATS